MFHILHRRLVQAEERPPSSRQFHPLSLCGQRSVRVSERRPGPPQLVALAVLPLATVH
jgi:hypothetical protein